MKRNCRGFLLVVSLICCMASAVAADAELSGDLQLRGFYRKDFSLDTAGTSEDWFDASIRVSVEEELTEDIGALLRMICQRDWGEATSDNTNVDVDLAVLTIENIWKTPATVFAGRQELLYGEGFLVGRNSDYTSGRYERGLRKAFDALKISLNFEPFIFDVFQAKLNEAYSGADTNLLGMNLTYNYHDTGSFDFGVFQKSNGEDDTSTLAFSIRGEGNIVAIPGLLLKGEVVPQQGDYSIGRKREAIGGYAGFIYAFENKCIPRPYFGANYILMSGDDGSAVGDYKGFDPLFDDELYGEINEVHPQGLRTNANILNLKLGCKPTKVLSIDLDYYNFKRNEAPGGIDAFGTEIDLRFAYDYDSNTVFALTAGWFDPDDSVGEENALQAVASIRRSF